ncbi:hypothetical protein [Oleidesulfovibrio alaskensis]|uniref:hypothetical protein n=1 Tax=Oleidesulfovibrio alaskensis TaxID=58180 RepID=UPI001A515997|nr:hypothetical protein [Oleidesulfovibrio alaskensis]MBL3583257.1 hypothetical protein [Oleidesulfovibrio alaskensis]
MAYIVSDISTFSGRDLLERTLSQNVHSGKKMAISDELISFYLLSLKVSEQYPTRIQTPMPTVSQEMLRGLFTNISL